MSTIVRNSTATQQRDNRAVGYDSTPLTRSILRQSTNKQTATEKSVTTRRCVQQYPRTKIILYLPIYNVYY